jgi:hypothetical protein
MNVVTKTSFGERKQSKTEVRIQNSAVEALVGPAFLGKGTYKKWKLLKWDA